ncbi:coproporphyrinogen III oxidase [Ammoniphilus oxalaticus]|uniref:Coproporphyrinogen III oxidase n=1 Tax=Ammoniphilus oxalaticus TaxID=66863 RepID=A0A419SIU0_9BACL|nr:coproporphyrinogen III oxidase [Ammoniphilus oxalaticus]RKD23931.1 coproporphyrinogen III oxidase [Ammoniphilus oxalaticus]
MFIRVIGIDRTMERQVAHIVQLFFEDAKVIFTNEQETTLQLEFIEHISEQMIQVKAQLLVVDTDIMTEEFQEASFPSNFNAEEKRKHRRRVIHQTLLLLLEAYTGMRQPWGILTGIRPTKLAHRKRREGLGAEQAQLQLQEEYLLTAEKVELMQQITERQLQAAPDLYRLGEEVSIYIGIPFCPTKCAYCTFPAYSIQGQQGSVDSFLGGLHYEMQQIGEWLKNRGIAITTVYFGGGTPTSISAEEMAALYGRMFDSFPNVNDIREITVEAGRPDTITPEKLAVLNRFEIDRISINPQSYHQETLDAIGRHHTVEETIEKFRLAREMGIDNINMDLIIGLPGEGLDEFQHTLRETEKLMPESLTVHTLSFKRASEMTQNKSKYKVADRDEVVEMMKLAERWTAQQGYVPYYLYRQKNILGNLENVGYAKPGLESLYNIMIMEEVQTIIGLGCGASSKFIHPRTGKITRFANPKEPRAYNLAFEKYTEDKLKLLDEHFESIYSS